MYYINSAHLRSIPINWRELTDVILHAIKLMGQGEYTQPVKPYLRYRDPKNRIIAMPAFIGGEFNLAGIKWIASFPGNVGRGIKRAHSVTILNEADTGIPFCTLNTPLISGIRTAAVSGLILQKVLSSRRETRKLKVGMTGFGPIGQLHLEMMDSLLADNVSGYHLYDTNGIDDARIRHDIRDKVIIRGSYQEAFEGADIFVTATVSDSPYIDRIPVTGSIHINVSLRDYQAGFRKYVDRMLVDNWEEVCRENTDIQRMHEDGLLVKEDTIDVIDIFCGNVLDDLKEQETVMFNPMGMAVFDVAVGYFIYMKAKQENVGVVLDEI
jgi:2,3-diaminopropionate biosynthesis protein SbnB